jgi:NADH-quinone oxidoreductase subunit M
MVDSSYLLLLLLVIPVAAIGLILVGPVRIGPLSFPNAPKVVATVAALLDFSLALVAWMYFDPRLTGLQMITDIPWVHLPGLPEIRFHIGLDGINLPLLLLTVTVCLAAIVIVPEDIRRPREFFIYLLLMLLGALGAFLSFDLFFLYIFHEFALIPTFLLIGIWGTQNRQFASMQMALYLTLGSLVLLGGLLALVFVVGGGDPTYRPTFDLVQIQAYLHNIPLSQHSQSVIYALVLAGFGVLISLFPFHSWAAPGYASAPPSAAMIHAGVLKKFGLYGLLRIAVPLLPGGMEHWQTWLLVLLLGNILLIGLVTLAQKEIQLMLGFSSVMHMGYLFLGIAALTQTSLTGVVILMVGHGLSAALLFGLAGEIQQRTGENRFKELGGLAQRAPFLAVSFLIGSLASIGLPGLANFPGELMIFFGSFKSAYVPNFVVILALWGIVLGAVYQLRAVRRIFFGELPVRYDKVTDLTGFVQRSPYILLMAALLFLGFFPTALQQTISPAVKLLLSH